MKSWKKKWKNELDHITPDLRDDIKNATIPSNENINYNGDGTSTLKITKSNIICIVVVCVALLLIGLILSICLIKPSNKIDDFILTLEINPTITLATNSKGKITGIISSNSDADVMLSDKNLLESVKDTNLDSAIKILIDYASKLGYIDLDNIGSVVRISGVGNVDFLSSAQVSLENYFIEKGVFALVVSESVSLEEFSVRSGINAGSTDKTIEFINKSEQLFYNRNSKGKSLSEVQNLYENIIVDAKLWGYAYNCLSENFDTIIRNAENINKISQLYISIFNHTDNPAKPFGDYWYVKQFGGDFSSAEFATLMAEMDYAIEKYKNDYGIEIKNITQLRQMAESYINVPITSIEGLLDDFSLDKFKEKALDLGQIMINAGLANTNFIDYLVRPNNFDDYMDKVSNLIVNEYEMRIEKYFDLYNKERQSIDIVDYQNFKETIIEQYGSLSDYWLIINKK